MKPPEQIRATESHNDGRGDTNRKSSSGQAVLYVYDVRLLTSQIISNGNATRGKATCRRLPNETWHNVHRGSATEGVELTLRENPARGIFNRGVEVRHKQDAHVVPIVARSRAALIMRFAPLD